MKEKLCYVGYDIHAEQKLAQGELLWTQFVLVVSLAGIYIMQNTIVRGGGGMVSWVKK